MAGLRFEHSAVVLLWCCRMAPSFAELAISRNATESNLPNLLQVEVLGALQT